MSDVWAKLSAVDVNEHKAKKGQFDYLSWADAWAELMKHYPDSTHDMLDDVYYPDGTMEVRSSVTVDGRTLKCFLPVINHKNQAIQNPNAFDINKNRMRCLAKNIALFGLGIYIFRGEDFPETGPLFTESQKATFLTLLGEDDGWGLKHFAREVGNDIMTELFNDAPQGHKTKIKSQVRELSLIHI